MGKHFGKAEATAAGEWSNFVIFLLEHGIKRTCFSTQMLYTVFSNLCWLISVPRNIVTLTLVGFFFSFFSTFRKVKKKNLHHQNLYKHEQGILSTLSTLRSQVLLRSDPTHKPAFDKRIYIFFFQFSCSIYLLKTENDMCNNGFI